MDSYMIPYMATVPVATLRVHPTTRDKVNALGAEVPGGASADQVIGRLLADHQKVLMLEAYDRLAADPERWADYLAEMGEWDVTADDGLDHE
jgi:hypothetical protein